MVAASLQRPLSLSSRPTLARRQMAGLLSEGGWRGDVDAVVLAAHEALVNADRHGGGATSVTAGFDGDSVVVEVCDRGAGFDLRGDGLPPDPTSERGRGLWLMSRLASRSEVVRSGDEVCVRLRFDA